MRKGPAMNAIRLIACAGALLFVVAAMPFAAHAQSKSKYANSTITVITSDQRGMPFRVSGQGATCWSTSSDDHAVGISLGDDFCVMTVLGSGDDSGMRARISASKIAFNLHGKSYSIADAGTVQRARGLFVQLEDLAQQQSDLGSKQRALGEKQRELGRQQRDVKVSVPDMSAEFEKVETLARRLSSQGATQDQLGDLQSALGDLQSRIGELQSQAGDVQSKFGDQQSALGDQQSELGDRQSDLGDKSQALAEDLAPKLRAILEGAIKNGTAKPE